MLNYADIQHTLSMGGLSSPPPHVASIEPKVKDLYSLGEVKLSETLVPSLKAIQGVSDELGHLITQNIFLHKSIFCAQAHMFLHSLNFWNMRRCHFLCHF
jgi:hypothetical protein